jgi:ribosomal protein S18 acetylase RimI-like enzyme
MPPERSAGAVWKPLPQGKESAMTSRPSWDLSVAAVDRKALAEATGLLAREMLDNPVHVAALGPDAERRERALQALFTTAMGEAVETPLAARRDGALVGVLCVAPPGACPPSAVGQMRMGSRLMLRLGPSTLARVSSWMGEWQRQDLRERHWHLGPLAVASDQRRRGVGARLLEAACERIDAEGGAPAVVQTDSDASLRLFERYGFASEAETVVLGVPTWLMVRRSS